MAASMKEIKEWYHQGREKNSAFLIVCTDTWDFEDSPRYVSSAEELHDLLATVRADSFMKAMEVYDLTIPFVETQDLIWQVPDKSNTNPVETTQSNQE